VTDLYQCATLLGFIPLLEEYISTNLNILVVNTYVINIKKISVFVISLIFCANLFAQNETASHNVFVRVYDLQNKKIGKGKILAITESSIQLIRGRKKIDTIPASNIGLIKTKRSGGHNVLLGAAAGAVIIGVSIASDTNEDNAFFSVEGDILGGAIMGGTVGVVLGGITGLSKNVVTYEINGEMAKWKAFEIMMLNNKVINKN
jgi:outer membrane lipoprotein SlyB